MKGIFSVIFMSLFMFSGYAADATDVTTAAVAAIVGTDRELSYGEKIGIVSTLEDDILILESEIKKCEKSKKGWIAATVIGSAGVVATGVAAGVQGAKIADKKEELNQHNEEKKKKEAELRELKNK